MKQTEQLIQDLERLNEDYLELCSVKLSPPKADVEVGNEKRRYVQAGELLRDFYEGVFVPKYSESGEIPKDKLDKINKYFWELSSLASKCIEQGNIFRLGVLLTSRENNIDGLNSLELLIEELNR